MPQAFYKVIWLLYGRIKAHKIIIPKDAKLQNILHILQLRRKVGNKASLDRQLVTRFNKNATKVPV